MPVGAMKAQLRPATPDDRDRLVELMAEFYAESGYRLNRDRAATAFAELVADERLGHVWLIQGDDHDAGYVVITFGYSMEYGGRDAVVDDLFLRPAFRGRGLGKATMAALRAKCQSAGIRALRLEVGRGKTAARALYRQAGFVEIDRQLLTLALAEPAHTG